MYLVGGDDNYAIDSRQEIHARLIAEMSAGPRLAVTPVLTQTDASEMKRKEAKTPHSAHSSRVCLCAHVG